VRDRLITVSNSFCIWRDYPDRPTADPDASLTLKDLSNRQHSTFPEQPTANLIAPSDSQPTHWPFPNPTTYAIMQWLNNGKTVKSAVIFWFNRPDLKALDLGPSASFGVGNYTGGEMVFPLHTWLES
jgi:hypothetical protein